MGQKTHRLTQIPYTDLDYTGNGMSKNYGKTTAKISRHLSYGAEKETVKPNSV